MRWNWLHLSDLHCGMSGSSWLWPRFEQTFFTDLESIHQDAGPWDLVLFTGDLTQQGTEEEYRELNGLLQRLWRHLEGLGSRPVLIAVPGNHDLARPPKTVADPLTRWAAAKSIPDAFWRFAQTPERAVISKAFAFYEAWWRGSPLYPSGVRAGLLPGDVSVTLEKAGARLGIIGLNTAFLQLTGDDYAGLLGLHVEQFLEVCPNRNLAQWSAQHQACLLLTHHPPGWLMPDALRHLREEITVPGQFAAHLFGHLHEARYTSTSEGGSEPRVHWQAASLFGLESYADNPSKLLRLHGYSAGRLEIVDAQTATLTCLPREARRGQDGMLRLVPDTSYALEEGTHTAPIRVRLLTAVKSAPPTPKPHEGSTSAYSPTEVVLENSTLRDAKVHVSSGPLSVQARNLKMRDFKVKKTSTDH